MSIDTSKTEPVAESGGAVAAPAPEGSGTDPFADLPFGDRPEIQAGIAFGASFVLAKIFKAIVT